MEIYDDKHFLENIRSFNNIFAFASLGAQTSVQPGMDLIVSKSMVKYTTELALFILIHVNDGAMDRYI